MSIKHCKIIATAFNPRRIVKGFQQWPHHGQVLHTPELYTEMVKNIVELECTFDPGLPVDTFIMVYMDKFGVWKEWLPYVDTPTKNGTLKIIFETEDGGSYQLYNKAYQILKNQYDWFMITCDDILVFGENYYKQILDKWTWDAGYIGLQGAGDGHVQGSIGLTHNYVLEKLAKDSGGELPHPKGSFVQERNIHEGEILYGGRIEALGFRLIPFNDSREWKKENLCFPYHNYINQIL